MGGALLEVEGERMPVVPRETWESTQEYVLYLRHLAAYALLAAGYTRGREVLEIGCGAGYGAHDISDSVSRIVAVDISRREVSAYWDKYRRREKLDFVLADGIKLPFGSCCFDVVISFQVIEHIEPRDIPGYLSEVRRVLRAGGVFICSTPNRKLRLLPFQRPWNREHKKEYDAQELRRLLRAAFEQASVQCLCASDAVLSIEKERVRQSPLKVYVFSPSHRIAGYVIPPSILRGARGLRGGLARRGSQHDQPISHVGGFSISAFRVNASCSRDCLDLYGICTKEQP